MKTLLLVASLIFFTTVLKSQTSTYHPFPHENAEWVELFGNQSFEPFDTLYYVQKFQAGGDTLILGKSFIKFMSGTGVYAYLRDDTANQKVYNLYDIGATAIDTLLYDFNLTVGASVSHSSEFLDFPDAHVTDVDSIFIDDNYRKRIKINYTHDFQADSTYWIEGMGSTNGIQLNIHDAFEFPRYRKLICYSEFTNVLYMSVEDWYDCDSVLIEQIPNAIDNFVDAELTFYPNPVSDFIQLEGNQSVINSITSATLININGSQVLPMQMYNNTILFNNQYTPQGIYFLEITTPENFYSFKIIKI